MNERIKELALQASDSIPDDVSAEHAMYLFQKKFAELIVRECAEFVDYRLTNPSGASMAWCDGSDIKEHFGVA